MAINEKITCDVCNAERGIDNHWFVMNNTVLESCGAGYVAMEITIWTSNYINYDYHICSSTCAARLIEQTLHKKDAPLA